MALEGPGRGPEGVKPIGLPYDPRDTPKSARAARAARRRDVSDRDYLAWMHGKPCLVCGAPGVVHHEPPKSHAGLWSDRSVVPLCVSHHARESPTGRHRLGLEGFEQQFGVDLLLAAQEYRRDYELLVGG